MECHGRIALYRSRKEISLIVPISWHNKNATQKDLGGRLERSGKHIFPKRANSAPCYILYFSYGTSEAMIASITGSDGRHGAFIIVMSGYHIKGWQKESDADWKPCKILSSLARVQTH